MIFEDGPTMLMEDNPIMVYEDFNIPIWQQLNYLQRILVKINHDQVAGLHTDFVVKLKLTDPAIKKIQPNGFDVRVYSIATQGNAELIFEREFLDLVNGVLILNIRIPSFIPNEDVGFYVYFNKGDVETVDKSAQPYVLNREVHVMHYQDSNLSDVIKDSGPLSINGQHRDVDGTPLPIFVSSPFGQAYVTDGSVAQSGKERYVAVSKDVWPDSGIFPEDGFLPKSMSFRIKWTTTTQDQSVGGSFGAIFARQQNGVFSDLRLSLSNTNPALAKILFRVGNAFAGEFGNINNLDITNFHTITVTVESNLLRVYVDGIQEISVIPNLLEPFTLNIAQGAADSSYSVGAWARDGAGWSNTEIEETILYRTVVSFDEHKTYHNMFVNSGFYTISIAENNITPADWFDTAFKLRKLFKINVGQVSAIETDFPVLINGIFPDLIGKMQENGEDIRIILLDNGVNTELKYEIQELDKNTGQLIVWAKVPTIKDGIKIYVYSDNPDAIDNQDSHNVWDSNYKAVWHLNKINELLETLDSTSNNNIGAVIASPSLVAGQIGTAIEFNGIDQYIDVASPSASSLDIFKSDLTIQGWIKPNIIIPVPGFQGIITKQHSATWSPPFAQYCFRLNGAKINFFSRPAGSTGVNSPTSIDTLGFQHVVCTYNNTTKLSRIYLGGIQDVLQTKDFSATTTSPHPVNLGRTPAPEYWDGTLDELRISNIERSATWIKTEFENQFNFNLFFTVNASEFIP